MMFFLIFQGYGFLALLLPALFYLAADAVDASPMVLSVCLLISAALVWLIGVRVNREPVIRSVGAGVAHRLRIKTRRHTVVFAPMQYAAIPIALLALYLMFRPKT